MNSTDAIKYRQTLDLIRCVRDQMGRARDEQETNAIIATLKKLDDELKALRG